MIRIVSEPLRDGGWVATHEDVTERQQLLEFRERAEAIAREKSAQLDAALNNMAHGLLSVRCGGCRARMLSGNLRAQRCAAAVRTSCP